MNTHIITQITEKPKFSSGNILDIVLSNDVSLVNSIETVKNGVSLTDHNTLKVVTMIALDKR